MFDATLDLYLDAAPWLLLGLVATGLIKAWMPEGALARHLGGEGLGPVLRAALIGAPLPLCSCGVLPAAMEIRRGGASKGATVSFLVATPETGPDSIALSYALLGPFMMVVRPVAAVFSAVVAGLLAGRAKEDPVAAAAPPPCGASCGASCANSRPGLVAGLRYAFTDALFDIAPWLTAGLIAAGAVVAFVPPMALAAWASGPLALIGMLGAGIPVYVCATASTPIAAGFLLAGVSPGAVLVFMLVGPATNIATIGVVGRDLGRGALMGYLGGIAIGALAAGLATDALVSVFAIDVTAEMAKAAELVPEPLAMAAGVIIVLPLGPRLFGWARGVLFRGHAGKA